MTDLRKQIEADLQSMAKGSIRDIARKFLGSLGSLGYQSERTIVLEGSKPESFRELVEAQSGAAKFDLTKALFPEWKSADILFQLTDPAFWASGILSLQPKLTEYEAITPTPSKE